MGGEDQEILGPGNEEFSEWRGLYEDIRLRLCIFNKKACNHSLTQSHTHTPQSHSDTHTHRVRVHVCEMSIRTLVRLKRKFMGPRTDKF